MQKTKAWKAAMRKQTPYFFNLLDLPAFILKNLMFLFMINFGYTKGITDINISAFMS